MMPPTISIGWEKNKKIKIIETGHLNSLEGGEVFNDEGTIGAIIAREYLVSPAMLLSKEVTWN